MFRTILILLLILPTFLSAQRAKKLRSKERKLIELTETKEPVQPFRVLTIDQKKDSVFLRKKARPVNLEKDSALIRLTYQRMLATVQHPKHLGVGIAAPQIGLRRRLIVIQRFDREGHPFQLMINPKLIYCSEEKQLGKEGCLSIPNKSGSVFRAKKITIEYMDLIGRKHMEEIDGFTSVIVQHEMDHLEGILFTDHLNAEAE